MQIYAEYFTKFDAANEKISWFIQIRLTAISKKEEKQYVGDILKTLEECRLKSKYGSYRLSDMIAWPSQRVFKYPLLFKELLKKTDQTHEARRYIEEIRDKMNEFIFYLNECKRDSENQSQIDKISKNLTMPSLNRNTNTECAKNYGRYIKGIFMLTVIFKYFELNL